MKVLFITNMYPIEKYMYYGIHVKEQIESIRNEHHIQQTIFFINGKATKLNYIFSIFKANYLAYKKKVDLIHVHFGLSGIFLLFNPFLKIPVVLTLHGSDVNTRNLLTKFIVRKVIARSKKVIVMNNEMYNNLKRFSKSIEVIPCGIDVDFFKPRERISRSNLVLGFPGDPQRKEKNYPLFLLIHNKLQQLGYNVEAVIFHNLSRAEVANKLNYIDILVLTSHSEGSPQIVKEAMACNTPIVTVPVGDVMDTLNKVDNCKIVNNYDPESLVKAILEIINSTGLPKTSLGRARLSELKLDHRSIANRIYSCYKALLV